MNNQIKFKDVNKSKIDHTYSMLAQVAKHDKYDYEFAYLNMRKVWKPDAIDLVFKFKYYGKQYYISCPIDCRKELESFGTNWIWAISYFLYNINSIEWTDEKTQTAIENLLKIWK